MRMNLSKTIRWVLRHWKLFVIYIPVMMGTALLLFVLVIYVQWRSDKAEAMDRLTRYKQLIDRTEEMKMGYVYSYSEILGGTKAVDLPTRIYDRNNEVIGEFFEQKRELVPYNFIPESLVSAVIASEDRDFYNHNGISYKGIARAMLVNIRHLGLRQGGSTVTQQLAKVLFTDMERTLKRKIYEAFCAREIEERYDKQDIMSMYLNLIYFGKGAYGVEAASRMFFGQSVRKLNEAESAMIVATISNPLYYSPLESLSRSVTKTRRILKSMVDAGFLDTRRAAYQYEQFIKKWNIQFNDNKKAIKSDIGTFIYSTYRVNRAPFFNERIRRILVEKFDEKTLKKGGLSIYTTIDGASQDYAREALRRGIEAQREYHRKRGEKGKAENIEGALVALDPYTGTIIAYVGGSGFTKDNQLDHVSQIRRQPGSSFKPLVYTAAFQRRKVTPSTVITDEKTTFSGNYTPRNYDMKYRGDIIVREALRQSVNIVAVKVLVNTGYSTVLDYVQNGLALSGGEMKKRFLSTPSLALGTYEVSPLENAMLHSMIVNGGKVVVPFGIREVKDYGGTTLWNNSEEVERELRNRRRATGTVIEPEAAAVTVSVLKGALEPGGTAYYAARRYGIRFPAAGKTGTSSGYNDAWFVGYTADMVTAVWIGNNAGAISLGPGRAGGVLSAPVWGEFVSRRYRHDPPGDFRILETDGLTKEKICLESGKVALPDGQCPTTAVQYYYQGSEPGEYCNLHDSSKKEGTDNNDTATQ